MKPIRIGALVGSGFLLSLGVIFTPGCSSTTTGSDGGGSEGGTTEGGGGDGGGFTCPTTVSCKNYCDTLTSGCSGANVQLDNATCNSLCTALSTDMSKVGKTSDTSGDTIGCRIYHGCVANGSASAAAMHCGHANIWSAGDTCGTHCDAFCQIAQTTCTGANAQFGGMNECLSKCGMWSAGKPTDTAGDTLGCREYHLGVATSSAANATMHCPHIGNGPAEGGGNPVCK